MGEMYMALDVVLLILGMALLVKGADWFVSGSSAIAKTLKIPPLIIGLTLVSMGTSAPEASVSINSAVNGMSDMSIGNVVGSNIFNTLLILGVSSLILPLSVSREIKKFDMPIMVAIYGILIIFSFVITPLKLDLAESIILLVLFIAYTVFLIVRAKQSSFNLPAASLQYEYKSKSNFKAAAEACSKPEAENAARARYDAESAAVKLASENAVNPQSNAKTKTRIKAKKAAKREKKRPIWLSIILTVLGLAGIILGGDLVVDNAADIAKALGMSEALVGLTIVAVGTSLPELVTSVVASIKKENDIAIGNVIGSNIFNIIFILGLSSSISTLTLNPSVLTDMLVMLGSGLLIMLIALFSKKLRRWQGAAMFLFYVGYLAYIIIRN